MTKLIKFFIISLTLTGCGRTISIIDIGEDFKPYYDAFLVESGPLGIDIRHMALKIQFGPMNMTSTTGRVIGTCDGTFELPTITIDKEFWDKAPDYTREELIFHELGHCILGRSHTSEVQPNGTPVSIMNPTLFTGYDLDRAYYVHELFHP